MIEHSADGILPLLKITFTFYLKTKKVQTKMVVVLISPEKELGL